MKTPREIIAEAQAQMSTYKHPEIDECKKLLTDIIEATGRGSISKDCLDSVEVYGGWVEIRTSWSSRGCRCDGESRFPDHILDDPNPVQAAKIWSIKREIDEAKHQLDIAKKDVIRYTNNVTEWEAALIAATA